MAEWPVGETIKPKGFCVLGWADDAGRHSMSWDGDEPVVWAVAFGFGKRDYNPFKLPSGVKLVCCADEKSAVEQAKQLGGVAVFGWGPR